MKKDVSEMSRHSLKTCRCFDQNIPLFLLECRDVFPTHSFSGHQASKSLNALMVVIQSFYLIEETE